MKPLWIFLTAACVLLVPADVTAQCKTYDPAFSIAFRDDPNADLQDYGRIHSDADGTNPACHLNAMYALEDKVQAHLAARPTTFQKWLDGYLVATIFAAAQRLGANGYATQELDVQLAALETRFKHFVPGPGEPHPSGGCGGDALNTCMDDYLGTASAYAWMAAYQKKRPNRVSQYTVTTNIANAKSYLDKALGRVTGTGDDQHGVCIRYKPVNVGSMVPLCNADVPALINGTAETFSVNGSNQMIHYGFGLLTSVASTTIGIEVAGSSVDWNTNDKKAIIKGLFEEAQRHINASNEFNSDCFGTNPVLTTMSPCGLPYRANMYRLAPFYKKYIYPTLPTAGTYTSNNLDSNLFDLDYNEAGFFSYGRYETYAKHGNTWVGTTTTPRPEMMAGDSHDPVGFFEGISSAGVAQGWTCDRDVPTKRVWIDFYADGVPTKVATGYANSASEAAINNLCYGGTAHRFWVQLPASTKGKKIRVYGLDYTWYGNTELGCLQSPQCSW